VSKTIGIAEKFLTAYEAGDAVTLKVTGIVGMDFSGMQLASAVESYATEGNVIIELDSVGGFVSDAFAFYDQVRAKGLKVSVDGYGTVASAATIIMAAAGRKRSRLSPNAEYLVHNASGGDAEGLKRANEKMADIYAELTGKDRKSILAKMKEDKPMSADDARKWGFVGSVIELQKLAALGGDKPQKMEKETTKETREFAVDLKAAASAIVTGKIAVEVDIDKEAADQIAALATEVKEVTAKAKEAEDTITARDEAIKAMSAEVVKIEASKADAEAKVAELTAKVAEHEATIASMKTTPIAPKVGPKGAAEPVVPGADNEAPVKYKKQTAEERRAAMAQMLKA
jgi:ATP-dependent Clp protease protease subunit